MFDIGWTELLVVGVVALIVVGPKDLPKMFRTLGQFTAKARNMAREFQRAMDDAADDTGVKDVARDLRKATSTREMGLDDLNDLKNPAKWTAKTGPKKTQAAKTPAADGEAAADAELDAVKREMETLRAERAEERARAASAAAGDPGATASQKAAKPQADVGAADASNENKPT